MGNGEKHQPSGEERRKKKETLVQFTSGVYEDAMGCHAEFSDRFGKKDFHNEEHIKAIYGAGKELIDAADEGDDPLGLQEQLDLWNGQNSEEYQIEDLREFKTFFKIAVSFHDQGNTGELINGNFKYFEDGKYRAEGAEDRGVVIAEVNIDNSNLSPTDKAKCKQIVSHLILQTKFLYESDRDPTEVPFAQFMRVVDQLSSEFFRVNEDYVRGLVNENAKDKAESKRKMKMSLRQMHNFTRNRGRELIEDEGKRDEVYVIWRVEEPEEDTQIDDTSYTMEDLAEQYDELMQAQYD